MRKFHGKLDRPGLDARVRATVKLLDEKMHARRRAVDGGDARSFFGSQTSTANEVPFSSVMLAGLRFGQKTGLFSLGKPLLEFKASDRGAAKSLLRHTPYSASVNGKPQLLSQEFGRLLDIGEERLRDSVNTYYLPAKVHQVHRTRSSH